MEYKILESPGTEIDHIDGAIFNNFSSGDQSGILRGVLDECVPVLVNSETVMVSAGELLIKGFRVKITSPYTITKQSNLYDTVYYIIAKLTVSSSKEVSFDIEARQTPDLVKDDLFTKGFGIHEIVLCRFVVTTYGITDLHRMAAVISGSPGNSDENISSGIYVGSDTPPDTATVWIDPSGDASSTEEWEFEVIGGSKVIKTVVVTESEEL